jgi:penicillin amidase
MINANLWDASESFVVDTIPTLRMVIDLRNPDQSQIIHVTGQSGHAFHPHYTDQMALWQQMKYHQMERNDQTLDKQNVLRLVPTIQPSEE